MVRRYGGPVIPQGDWSGEDEGNPQAELAKGHSAGHPSDQVCHETGYDVDYHGITGGAGDADGAALAPQAPRVDWIIEMRGIAKHYIADQWVEK